MTPLADLLLYAAAFLVAAFTLAALTDTYLRARDEARRKRQVKPETHQVPEREDQMTFDRSGYDMPRRPRGPTTTQKIVALLVLFPLAFALSVALFTWLATVGVGVLHGTVLPDVRPVGWRTLVLPMAGVVAVLTTVNAVRRRP